jgi:hypothetical protein
MVHPIVEAFRREWPAAFAGPEIDRLSGNAIRWSTTQNRRSRREIPEECFVRRGARLTLVVRDPFLAWWETTLSDARQTPRLISPRRGPGRRPRAASRADRAC